jgi:UDP-N-acetylmuramate dehydrogenase
MDEKSKIYQRLRQVFRGKLLVDEPMSLHTSFRIGGNADFYMYPKDLEDLSSVLDFCQRDGIFRFIIGNGTNILVGDEGIRGVVIDLSETFHQINSRGTMVTAGGGVSLKKLLEYCTQRGLSGFERITGIPGQIGGCLCLNAGAFGREISDCLHSVRLLDCFGTLEKREKKEIHWGYRFSDIPEHAVIVEAQFIFTEGNPKQMEREQDSYLRERKTKQPLSLPSAGSVFKRPPGDYAGRLIEEAGCKGLRIGDAMVSRKHANFIVNCHLASARDVIRLIEEVQQRVFNQFKVELNPEIYLIGVESP